MTLPLNKWWFYLIIAIILIIIIVIIKRNWYKVERLFQSTDIDLEQGETASIPEARKRVLESYARQIYSAIHGSYNDNAYDMLLNITDNELKYTSVFYRKQLSGGVWLWTEIDDESFSYSNNRDVQLKARLAKVGEQG